jgi:hypothetical protein
LTSAEKEAEALESGKASAEFVSSRLFYRAAGSVGVPYDGHWVKDL